MHFLGSLNGKINKQNTFFFCSSKRVILRIWGTLKKKSLPLPTHVFNVFVLKNRKQFLKTSTKLALIFYFILLIVILCQILRLTRLAFNLFLLMVNGIISNYWYNKD